jgi:hypothetical protein
MKVYNALALLAVLYGCETWAVREQDNVSGNGINEENNKVHTARLQNQ